MLRLRYANGCATGHTLMRARADYSTPQDAAAKAVAVPRVRRSPHGRANAEPGLELLAPIVPVAIPPVAPFSFCNWFVACRWDGRLGSAGRHCNEGDCFWRADIGVIGPEQEAVSEHSWESLILASSAALPSNKYRIRRGSLDTLPARDFRNCGMSPALAERAIRDLARGVGTEAWWMLAKRDAACGGFVLPLPAYPTAAVLFLFERHRARLRMQETEQLTMSLFVP